MAALKYWLWLTEKKKLTNQVRLALLEHFGSPEDLYFSDSGEYLQVPGMSRVMAAELEEKDLSATDRILGECQRLNIRIMTMQDAAYPSRLKNIYDPPCLLYTKGTMPLLDEEAAVAVVGTRDATPYGISSAEKLGYELASQGAVIVSGVARGADSAAIRGALRAGGVTVGVLGGGIDVVYPPENEYLYQDIAASGVLMSEYPPGTEPAGRHFPVRNRILSGLCVATLVVEAPERSGALITAATALEQGRDVFAVPGPIDAPASAGCNRLIRDGAGLVSESWDLLREYEHHFPGKLRAGKPHAPANLGYEARQAAPPARPARETLHLSEAGLTDDQIRILKTLGDEPMLVDDLIEWTGLSARRVLTALTMLEIDNYVSQSSGKRFARSVTLAE
ncbi:DNA-protecting protein DprA [Oscillibacter hominis]|uniref:DNA-protecting protein DprA n=1 Tax=Oscillibacter hominis TaxID=2763056 RepID=A0A7G9B5G1_9FIRM|nr:DNA-processing protein DprA [Oscillibacter hominis]QNL44792.1 DNA-protecting protein DprA [Oscillibacter hominis]